jgi:hypothetical protein
VEGRQWKEGAKKKGSERKEPRSKAVEEKKATHLKWLIDCKTSSSNSIGPGISNAG